ncbi:LysR substrate-binding domain-containing protein [Rhizobium leguminosarum]|uniref:LysR family transcriptional regulator n=1 Tax=Rhizobium leguminosarum TaxID=384 RepID=UPI003F97F910
MTERGAIPKCDLNLLGPLHVLLIERNVTVAARVLGIGQSTMSGILARLREQLQDPLLVRVGRNMELTPRAARLSEELGQLLLRVDQITALEEEFDPQRSQCRFRIMASEAGLLMIIPALFRKVVDHAPGIAFEVLPIDKPADSVFAGTVDLAITGDSVSEIAGERAIAIRTQTLYEESLVGLVDAGHPVRGSITLEEFRSFPRIATQFPGISRTVEELAVADLFSSTPPKLRVASFLAIGALVAGTTAVGIVPKRIAALLPNHQSLRTLALPAEFPRFSIRALWHSRHDLDAAHRWLRKQVLEIAGEVKRGQEDLSDPHSD